MNLILILALNMHPSDTTPINWKPIIHKPSVPLVWTILLVFGLSVSATPASYELVVKLLKQDYFIELCASKFQELAAVQLNNNITQSNTTEKQRYAFANEILSHPTNDVKYFRVIVTKVLNETWSSNPLGSITESIVSRTTDQIDFITNFIATSFTNSYDVWANVH
jgi:hypothetical protein